ncbi:MULTISPECIES: NAD(P)/FAD-dependent oxidoreductase [Paraburkholderia]|uniref:NAD(P)/FAD-dependent oxidoreductase n=1 Tax=Paraburkholderia TaxID=1822464 RepID=UPI001655C61B|nr:hypothetical protein [Paraburkholderia podalyriae]
MPIGDNAGFLNASRIKVSYGAIKSGTLAADAAFDAIRCGRVRNELSAYPEPFKRS